MTEPQDVEQLKKELDYYKRQIEELTAAQLKLEYRIPGLTHELGQKRKGFALLSKLQQSIGAHQQISSIFDITISAINSTLGMDRTVVLTSTERANVYRPSLWTGFREEMAKNFSTVEIELPAAFNEADAYLLVNRTVEKTPLIEQIQAAFDLPYFAAVPVLGDLGPIGVILSGRLKEARPLYPPLDQGDVDTFRAIAGLIAATVQNMRVALLVETDRLKTEFFANISHEFRTPITLTIGPLEQALSGRYGSLPEQARAQLELMLRNQERLLGLVNQILDLAKLEAGKMTMKAAPIADVNRFVRDRAEQFRGVAQQRNLDLRLSLDPKLQGADLYLDREKMDKLLFNLLSNAFKFTKQGFVEVATALSNGTFQLTVIDSGIGIKEDQLPFIFDRFRQADSGESREYSGTGLGLALVNEVAKLHGGDVTAHSQLGRGSTFEVTLPLGRAHLDPSAIADFDEEEQSQPLSWQRMAAVAEDRADRRDIDDVNAQTPDPARAMVLYAEDNPDLRKYVYDLLAPSYNVLLAADGAEGLAAARRHHPDLILTDFMMPHVSGREFLQSIRADAELSRTPVIFLTARAGTGARIESLEAGADDYLTKPFDQGELLARVRNVLHARKQERELERLNQRLEAKIHEQMAELVRTGELKRFLPASIVKNLLAGTLTPEKPFERRKITSLSIGIGNFPALTETLEAEDLALVVNDFIRQITAIAIENGGTVDKIVADTVHVLFGAPEEMPVEQQASAALQSALQARSKLADGSKLQAGINTGYCTLGVFGSELLSNYTAIGEPVNVAARLRAAAPAGGILLGAQSHAVLQSQIEAAGPKTLTGSLHPIAYYEVAPSATQAGVPDMTPQTRIAPGAKLGQFKIVSRLGAGGMGEVFLAEDEKLHRPVALKIAPHNITDDEVSKARFFLEARSASALNHANIAHIYDIGEDAGISYIAMEYVDGATLRTKIGGSPLTLDEMLSISLQIGGALEEAHRKGVVHRDIKPENIILTPRGELKVLDFGLAKLMSRDGDFDTDIHTQRMLTRPGTVMGTVHYMSPEQALGRDVDFRTDIFSLGVVMYEMATGRLPFSAATATETIDLIVHAEPMAINRFNYTVPGEVDYVIRKCLQKNPASRYQSTTELVVDLRNLGSHLKKSG